MSKYKNPNYNPKTKVGTDNKKTICVNFFAGAGAGKSTVASIVHGFCKMHNVTSEYTAEYAKDMAWEGRLDLKINDVHIFGEQHNRQFRLNGQVDCIISDSPLLLSSVYRTSDTLLHAFVLQEFKKYENLNFFVKRTKPFIKKGRQGGLSYATSIDQKIINMLDNEQIPYTTITGDLEGVNKAISIVLKRLNVTQKYIIRG